MPELPDVEGFKSQFDQGAPRKRVKRITVPDSRILDGISASGLGRRLKGSVFSGSRRHGKLLFAEVDGGGGVALHFGMTGSLAFFAGGEDPPEQAVFVVMFEDGKHFAYLSRRMLGRVAWFDEVGAFVERDGLGADALAEDLDADRFLKILSGRSGILKSALMDQSIVAGIGNEWSDEILFQCGLNPKVKVSDLDAPERRDVFRTARRVLRTGARAAAEGRRLPGSYLLSNREEGADCPRCGGSIGTMKVSGRTSYYCSRCQR